MVSVLARTISLAAVALMLVCGTAAGTAVPTKVHAGASTEFIVAAAGSIWTTDRVLNRVYRIDPLRNRVTARIRSRGLQPFGIAYGAGSIWVGNRASGTIVRINPKKNKARKKKIRVGSPYAIAYGARSVWVTDEFRGRVRRISARKNRVVKTIRVGGDPNGIAFAFGAVWVADFGRGRVLRIDPAHNRVTGRVALEHADWITPVGDYLWVSSETNAVYRLDPASMQIVAKVPVGKNPLASALVGGDLWVPNIDSNSVSVVDVASGEVRRTINVGQSPIAVVQAGGDAWVSAEIDGDLWRLSPSG